MLELPEKVDAAFPAFPALEPYVDDGRVQGMAGSLRGRRLVAGGDGDAEALPAEEIGETVTDPLLVIHDEDGGAPHGASPA